MTHWARQCRCSGIGRPDTDPGPWCGRPATEEDGLCGYCRNQCIPHKGAVLTMDQARTRARLALVTESMTSND